MELRSIQRSVFISPSVEKFALKHVKWFPKDKLSLLIIFEGTRTENVHYLVNHVYHNIMITVSFIAYVMIMRSFIH